MVKENNMLYSDKEIEIKIKILNLLKTFRSLGLLTEFRYYNNRTIIQQINMMLLKNTTTKQYLMTDLLLIGS